MRSQQVEVNAHEKQQRALELRKSGASYAAIAKALGYRGPSGAHAAVAAALKKTLQEPADEVRTLELERLDAMLLAIWRQVKDGNHGAIDRALRIQERRAKLLGLDAPAKQELTGRDGGPVETKEVGDDGLKSRLDRVLALLDRARERGSRVSFGGKELPPA